MCSVNHQIKFEACIKNKFLQSIFLYLFTINCSFSQNYLYGDQKGIFSKHYSTVVVGEQIDSTTFAIEVRKKKKEFYSSSFDTLRGANASFAGKKYKIIIEKNSFTLYPGNIRLIRRPFPISSDPFTRNFDLIYNYYEYWENFDSVSIVDYRTFWFKKKHIVRKDSSYMESLWKQLTDIDNIQNRSYTSARIHLAFFYVAFGIVQPVFFLLIYPAAVATIISIETEKFLTNQIHGKKTIIVKCYSSGKYLKLRIKKGSIITEKYKYKLTGSLDRFFQS